MNNLKNKQAEKKIAKIVKLLSKKPRTGSSEVGRLFLSLIKTIRSSSVSSATLQKHLSANSNKEKLTYLYLSSFLFYWKFSISINITQKVRYWLRLSLLLRLNQVWRLLSNHSIWINRLWMIKKLTWSRNFLFLVLCLVDWPRQLIWM